MTASEDLVIGKDGPLTRPHGLAACRVRLLTASGGALVIPGYFRVEDPEVIPETVLARMKDGMITEPTSESPS